MVEKCGKYLEQLAHVLDSLSKSITDIISFRGSAPNLWFYSHIRSPRQPKISFGTKMLIARYSVEQRVS